MDEVTELATEHAHASPQGLALDLDELDEKSFQEVEERVVSCGTCFEGLETLVYWLDVLGHWDPRVGPEFLCAHARMADLLFTEDSHRQRLDRIRDEFPFHGWGLARLMLDESRRASSRSGLIAQQLAELTQAIVGTLDPEFYGAPWVADLRAEAAANLAVLERGRKRFGESRRLFRLARACLSGGTGRPEVARCVRGHESLFGRDRCSQDELADSSVGEDSSTLSPREVDLPRPVHDLFERCKAAREGR